MQRLLSFGSDCDRLSRWVSLPRHSQGPEDEHTVIRGNRPPAFRHDAGMRYTGFVAHRQHGIDHVACVLVERVIHARLEIGSRAVVVDPQPAADIQQFEPRSPLVQVDIDSGRLVDCRLHLTDVGDLASQVEMQQFEAVGHAARFQFLQTGQQLADGQPELAAISSRRLPPSAPTRCELDPHADTGTHADFFGVLQDERQFGVLLHDRNDLATQLLGQHCHFDELGVLEAVADDGCAGIRHGDDREEFRLAARLEPVPEFAPVLDNLLHHLALLIDLDREHAGVGAPILVLGDRGPEHIVQLSQPFLKNAVEPQQDRQLKPPQLQSIDQFLHVDRLLGIALRMHAQMAVFANGKEPVSPAWNFVEFLGVGNRPGFFGVLNHCKSLRKQAAGKRWCMCARLVRMYKLRLNPWQVSGGAALVAFSGPGGAGTSGILPGSLPGWPGEVRGRTERGK